MALEVGELESCCHGLESTKITERKKNADILRNLMENRAVVRSLSDESSHLTWNSLTASVHRFLIKEAEKFEEDERKKRTISQSTISFTARNNGDLLIGVVHKANSREKKLNVSKLVEYVLQCFGSRMLRKYFIVTYLTLLKDHILSVKSYWGQIQSQEWITLLFHLKSFYQTPPSGVEELKPLQCLQLLLQWGPLHCLPGTQLRGEFTFIIQIAQQVNGSSSRLQQETVLKLLLEFCVQTAEDNRMACCKLGEELFGNLIGIYQAHVPDNVKILVLEFLLLQIRIHHPKGMPEGAVSAYACSWSDWRKNIRCLYSILCYEMSNNVQVKFRSFAPLTKQKCLDMLDKTFVALLVEVFKQVLSGDSANITFNMTQSSHSSQPPSSKRPRVEVGVPAIISNIQESKDWPWINAMTELLRKYPDVLTPGDFVSLLRVLSMHQAECKFSNIRYHLYECLAVLVDVEAHIDVSAHSGTVSSLWTNVWECTLRAVGLNENEEQTHKVLQKLITERKVSVSTQLFKTYMSQALKVSKYSLQTLNHACSRFGLPEGDAQCAVSGEDNRRNLLKWILNIDTDKPLNTAVFSEPITAQVLLFLTLRQWPSIFQSRKVNSHHYKENALEYVYLITSFDGGLVFDNDASPSNLEEMKCDDRVYLNHSETYGYLQELLHEFTGLFLQPESRNSSTALNLVNVVILLTNLLSLMIHYNVLPEKDLADHRLTRMLMSSMEQCCDVIQNLLERLNKRNLAHLGDVFQQIVKLFECKVHDAVLMTIRKALPIDFIKKMFELLNEEEQSTDENEVNQEQHLRFSLAILNVLCSYCRVPNANCMFDIQQYVLETLADPNFESMNMEDYERTMAVLQALSKYRPGTLSNKVLEKVLECLQQICQAHYTSYDTALSVLQILYDLYPHIALSDSEELEENSVSLLHEFYQQHKNYGPNVSVALINCLGQLAKVDRNADWSKWPTNVKAFTAIPVFLNSDFQKVRLAAVKSLYIIFSMPPKDDVQVTQHISLFNTVDAKCTEVFNIAGDLSQERQVDETVTRTASALHTYATLMAASSLLRQKSLFSLLQLVYKKKLNIDSTLRVLEMVAKHLNVSDAFTLLQLNLNYLVLQWQSENFALDEFPCTLLRCTSALEFYANYTDVMVPLLIADNPGLLAEISRNNGKSVEEMVEVSFPSTISRCLLIATVEKSVEHKISQKELEFKCKCLHNLTNILTTEKLDELLMAKLDEVVGFILQYCFDPQAISTKFAVHCALPEPQQPFFSVSAILKTINYLEEKYLNQHTLIAYCMSQCPGKLQRMLLTAVANIHSSISTDEKVKAFHQYTILIDLIIPHLQEKNKLSTYIIRTISYTLIHLINNCHENDSILNSMCCGYASLFISQILPENAKALKHFLVTFVSILIPIARCNSNVGRECIKLLNLMIVDHVGDLNDAIKTLDPFPQDGKFSRMQQIYEEVKYGHKTFSLEEEMQYFLNTGLLMGSSGNRTEGLRHLKEQLSMKKLELKELYSRLHHVRGFSEDCEKSVLHQLICALVKLSLSADSNESVEATRCLGELGSSDLLTTVLQTEQKCGYNKTNPFELVTGRVVALLTKYIVDVEVEVMQVASEALYLVLDCKEGKSVLESHIDYGEGTIERAYVAPFLSLRKLRADTSYSLKGDFAASVNSDSLWFPETAVSHAEWINKLVRTILESFTDKCYLRNLIPVCNVKVAFSERLLPLLVYLILSSGREDLVSLQIQRFFRMHWILSLQGRNSDSIAMNKLSVQCMLNVVHFIRLRQNMENSRNMVNLSLNYLHVAQAAQFCTAHFTALLYVELWCQERITELRAAGAVEAGSSALTPLDMIFEHEEPDVRQTLQNILREGYKKVGELDALHTCETIGLLDSRLRAERYENLQRWEQAALLYDIQVSQGNSDCVPKLLNALKNNSLLQLPLKYENSIEPQYECAWRLSNWTINKTETHKSENYEMYKYFALKALHNNDNSSFKSAIADMRSSIVDNLRHASLESSKNLYEPLSQLQSLQELEDFVQAKNDGVFEPLLEKWKVQDDINRNEFQYIEPIQAQRIVVLNDLVSSGHHMLKDALVQMHLKLADLARYEGKANVANRALGSLLHISDLKPEVKNHIMVEEAQLRWLDDKVAARYILRHLLSKPPSTRLHAAALKLYGTWMAETCSENPQLVIANYFMKSLDLLKKLEKTDVDVTNMCETYDVLARFADLEYQQLLTYVKSSVFERKVQNMEKAKATAVNIKRQANGKLSVDEMKAKITHERQSLIDQTEIKNTHKEQNNYLVLAMKYYMRNIQYSDINNIRMFRILSLWLENRTNDDLEILLDQNMTKIPKYKFIPILPQLVPHITSSKEDSLGNRIFTILEQCIAEHPHHTLPVVLALANSNTDKNYYKSTTNTISNEPRIAGAEKLVQKFRNRPETAQIVTRMEAMGKAIMELAYLDDKCCSIVEKGNFKIPNKCAIMKIKNFDDVLLPTYSMPVQKNGDYSNIVGIHSFSTTFSNVGGVNAPKRIWCMGTDGQRRNQLVKGKDDLRQDAVMQQVFNIMNGLLALNKQTAKLLIRTYKIVPLSQRSGILEWVENSMRLGDYLMGEDGKSGAHQMYNPRDMTPSRCRAEYQSAAKLPNSDKLRIYKHICSQLQPVFHKFFETSFVQPAVWYERRRAYMYSVATSSMCGYILGLGDRHVTNILIDKTTAEVVHIDFGIAFEQGQVLPTPETVPFRLTRDIEAGMGVSGIEGVFRKSCERTLEVLRKNSETIISIVEVLLYDPLYAWTITPAEAYSHQFRDDHDENTSNSHSIEFSDQENVNITADRALLRLRQKLQGTAEGGSTSVEGQVEKLLQLARDPSNLCRLYHGWQPYL